MTTIKSYTDINQSRKLAEFLPIESADMCYPLPCEDGDKPLLEQGGFGAIPCWSFTALFNILPDDTDVVKGKSDTENEKYVCTVGVTNGIISTFGNNPIDTCYKMMLELNKLKLL